MHCSNRVCSLTALICCLAVPVHGPATGTISGLVVDAAGLPVGGAKVTASDLGTGLTRNTTSESTGQFVLPLIPVECYEVLVEGSGFAPFR